MSSDDDLCAEQVLFLDSLFETSPEDLSNEKVLGMVYKNGMTTSTESTINKLYEQNDDHVCCLKAMQKSKDRMV